MKHRPARRVFYSLAVLILLLGQLLPTGIALAGPPMAAQGADSPLYSRRIAVEDRATLTCASTAWPPPRSPSAPDKTSLSAVRLASLERRRGRPALHMGHANLWPGYVVGTTKVVIGNNCAYSGVPPACPSLCLRHLQRELCRAYYPRRLYHCEGQRPPSFHAPLP